MLTDQADQLILRSGRADADSLRVIGLDLSSITPGSRNCRRHFLHDQGRGAADGLDRKGREQPGQRAADQQADEDQRPITRMPTAP